MTIGPQSYLILHSRHDGALDRPWVVILCYHGDHFQKDLFEGDRASAMAYLAAHWEDEQPALARIQAAGVDLYEALKWALAHLEVSSSCDPQIEVTMTAARAAIAKAEGGAS